MAIDVMHIQPGQPYVFFLFLKIVFALKRYQAALGTKMIKSNLEMVVGAYVVKRCRHFLVISNPTAENGLIAAPFLPDSVGTMRCFETGVHNRPMSRVFRHQPRITMHCNRRLKIANPTNSARNFSPPANGFRDSPA